MRDFASTSAAGRTTYIFCGGVAAIGGIEAFTKDFVQLLSGSGWPVTVLAWARDSNSLRTLRAERVILKRSKLSFGCRCGLPDFWLVLTNLFEILQANVLVFVKLPGRLTFQLLRVARWLLRRDLAFV